MLPAFLSQDTSSYLPATASGAGPAGQTGAMTRYARSVGSGWGTRLFLAGFVVYLGGALLWVAFVGTAATFNAPSHVVFHVIGADPAITGFHFAFHVVSGVAYVWAVLLFPDGRLPLVAGRRATAVAAVASTALITFVCYRSSF